MITDEQEKTDYSRKDYEKFKQATRDVFAVLRHSELGPSEVLSLHLRMAAMACGAMLRSGFIKPENKDELRTLATQVLEMELDAVWEQSGWLEGFESDNHEHQ